MTTNPEQHETPAPERAETPEPSPPSAPATPPSHEPPPVPEAPSAPAGPPTITDSMHAEIEAAMAELDAAKEEPERPRQSIRGPRVIEAGREHRTGVVVSVGPEDVFVEFGPKELGIVPRTQFKGDAALPATGEEIEVVVDRYEPAESIFICSLPGTVTKADWEMLHPGQTVEARVAGVNKGGLDMEVAGHRAFMPASQVSFERIEDLSVFVGEKLTCRVQRVDRRGKGNIVLSRRDLLAEERAEQAKSLKETLNEGDVVEGTVRKIMPFGAFVDLGGVDGLVHLSDLTHARVNQGEKHIEKFVSEGQRVRVQVLKLDWDANRISLGMKQLQDDPFEQMMAGLAEGSEVDGTVTRCADFGAFVEIAPGVEGLIHISELAYKRVNTCDEIVKPGQRITTKVVKLDRDNRRIGLSLKQMTEPPKQAGGGRRDKDRGPSADEILKVTPQLRRLREKAKKEGKDKKVGGLGGLDLGQGLGDLRL